MANYYELLEIDPVTLQQNAPENRQKMILKAYREAAMIHHPDKGGDAEIFKELNHAREILLDECKRKTYDHMLEEQVHTQVFDGLTRPKDVPESSELAYTYLAIAELNDIKQAFNEFARDKIGEEGILSEHGYTARIERDDKTGQDMLILSFPNTDTMKEFTNQMINRGMIKDPYELHEERGSSNRCPNPFDKMLTP